jgi:F0F1-type ATP synthase membrane subunit b/b'
MTAWKPLLAALAAREEKIRSSLEEAERARAESRRLLEENKRQQAQAEVQAVEARASL